MRPRAEAMRNLLNQPGLTIMPGCGDGMSAHLVAEAGFKTAFASGSSISAMRLAMPDMDLLTFPEMRDVTETMIGVAPNVLWLADGDTGYGNALSVQKTIRAYARAGAAAVLIEDKIWPTLSGAKVPSWSWIAKQPGCAAEQRWKRAGRRVFCCWPERMRGRRMGSMKPWHD